MGTHILTVIDDLLLYSKVKAIIERFGMIPERIGSSELRTGLDTKSCVGFIVDLTHYGEAVLALPVANNRNLVRIGIVGHLEKDLIDKARAGGFEVVVRSTLDSRLAEIIRGLASSR